MLCVHLVIYDSGQVSLENLLLSWYPTLYQRCIRTRTGAFWRRGGPFFRASRSWSRAWRSARPSASDPTSLRASGAKLVKADALLASPGGARESSTCVEFVLLSTLGVTQGQTLCQSPTDACRFW